MGRTVDIPAPIFGVEIPDLFYRGVVLKKDKAHAGGLYLCNPSERSCGCSAVYAYAPHTAAHHQRSA